MIQQQDIEAVLRAYPDVHCQYPFEAGLAVYDVGGTMFALLKEGSKPLRLSLRCDHNLARVLRERYESVLPGDKLDASKWITLVLSGQLNLQEVKDLIQLAYQLGQSGHDDRVD
jgi:predicted DNA-binding protein (MmcQ/YjbR family)